MIKEEVKKGYQKAYEWMIGVQQALMFKKASVAIGTCFTPSNFKKDESDGWTVDITIIDDETGLRVSASWTPWYGESEEFLAKKAAIDEFVRKKCSVIISAYGDKWTSVESCPKTGNSWLCATIGEDQIWVDETEWKKFLLKDDKWYECAI